MKHPPVPPNCKWIFVLEGESFCGPKWTHNKKYWSHYCDYPIRIDESIADFERSVVAVVARCGWMDVKNHCPDCDEGSEAARHAEQWRKWGLGENWE